MINCPYLIHIDHNGNLLWKHNYPHVASPGVSFNYDPLFLDEIHRCIDGTFDLFEFHGGSARTVGGLYSKLEASTFFILIKLI